MLPSALFPARPGTNMASSVEPEYFWRFIYCEFVETCPTFIFDTKSVSCLALVLSSSLRNRLSVVQQLLLFLISRSVLVAIADASPGVLVTAPPPTRQLANPILQKALLSYEDRDP